MILEQFSNLQVSRFEIVLQSSSEAILPALIGSTLRGAFGHALKAVSCSVEHQDCKNCFLSDACLYTTIFEPVSPKMRDIPRPFIFEPPIPPLTREISDSQKLQLRVAPNGKISFGLTLIGECVRQLPYFIYAFELMARHGLGVDRHSFAVFQVFNIDVTNAKTSIYTTDLPTVLHFPEPTLFEFVSHRLNQIGSADALSIQFQTPLRIRRNKVLLEKLTFAEIFKQSSLRLKFLSENYGFPLEYDYQMLAREAESVETISTDTWRHGLSRRSNRQDRSFDLDGMLGEIVFRSKNLEQFLPFIVACELLHIGSASGLGLGKYAVSLI